MHNAALNRSPVVLTSKDAWHYYLDFVSPSCRVEETSGKAIVNENAVYTTMIMCIDIVKCA